MITESYRRQVGLLLRLLPFVSAEECFALKGGTAINLFFREMPRLSVDIDLTYLPVKSRPESLAEIDAAMKRIQKRIEKDIPSSTVTNRLTEKAITKLLVRTEGAMVKIELSPVMRGTVFEPEWRSVSSAVEDAFQFAEIKVVSFPDLYAGKILAALDRQHPRDFFDVRDLLANEGVDDALREAFIVYLLGHNRPMGLTLSGRRKDLTAEYKNGFVGMTGIPVSMDDLMATRTDLIDIIIGGMPEKHKRFLIGFESGNPDWSLLGVAHASGLPAVLWRRQNLDTLSSGERDTLVSRLRRSLSVYGSEM